MPSVLNWPSVLSESEASEGSLLDLRQGAGPHTCQQVPASTRPFQRQASCVAPGRLLYKRTARLSEGTSADFEKVRQASYSIKPEAELTMSAHCHQMAGPLSHTCHGHRQRSAPFVRRQQKHCCQQSWLVSPVHGRPSRTCAGLLPFYKGQKLSFMLHDAARSFAME